MKTLVTGCAGFIGLYVVQKLLAKKISVIGIDDLNNYYDSDLKKARLNQIKEFCNKNSISHDKYFQFEKLDLSDQKKTNDLFKKNNVEKVIHLAATPGVRYSMKAPLVYVKNNITAFTNIIECSKEFELKHFTYASTSSVYGANIELPYKTDMNTDHPIQFYAVTKKSNELMAHSYSHLYNLPTTGLRFFTVYGPWTRPDMALFIFTKNILEKKPIQIFNNGDQTRDFTYVEDIAESIVKASDKPPKKNSSLLKSHLKPDESYAPYRVYNIGNSQSVELITYVELIEKHLGIKADKEFLPAQPGDVKDTLSDNSKFIEDIGEIKNTNISVGIKNFVDWYKNYHGYN